MLFKKKLSILICLSIIFLFIIGFIAYMLNYSPSIEYFIFQNIDECEQLIPSEQSNFVIERYDTPDKDKNSKNLSYEFFWGINFESDGLKYEIFAYEFIDSDSALKYYANVTGQSYDEKLLLSNDGDNKLLSSSKGMFSYRLVVVCQNRAYLVIAPKKYANDINTLLANTFSHKLSWIN